MITRILIALLLSSASAMTYSHDERQEPTDENGESFYPKAEGSFRIMSYNVGAFSKFMTEVRSAFSIFLLLFLRLPSG